LRSESDGRNTSASTKARDNERDTESYSGGEKPKNIRFHADGPQEPRERKNLGDKSAADNGPPERCVAGVGLV
jgi:hypothetical protein